MENEDKKSSPKLKFDEDYLNTLIQNAKKNWQGIDADEWLHSVRGDYEI
jgi:hypothetical protein